MKDHKGIKLFLHSKEEMKEYLKDLSKHIEEKYGYTDEENQKLMTVFFLHNCHETISSIASEFSNGRISKSTYEKSVYISVIQDAQQEHYETMHFEDIEDYIVAEDINGQLNSKDLLEFLKKYFSSRDTFREETGGENEQS